MRHAYWKNINILLLKRRVPLNLLPLFQRRRFLKGWYHIWVWRPSWSCVPDPRINFRSPVPCRLHIKFGFDQPSGFRDVQRVWTTTTEPAYTISLPMSLKTQMSEKAINRLIKDSDWQPYLSSDRNHFWADATRPPDEHFGQILKKSERCDYEIVTISKMAAFQPYLLTDQNYFRADRPIHLEEFIC